MKNSFVILAILCTIFACTKETETICKGPTCELQGSWKWTSTYGTIAGQTWTPESTGIEKKIELTEDKISFYESGTIVNTYPYYIFESDTIFGGSDVYKFISYNQDIRWYKIEGDKLEIHDTCFDCYDDYYEKVE